MKIKWIIPVLALVAVQCKKADTETGTVCVSNKTGLDLTGLSFVDVISGNNLFRASDLTNNGQQCNKLVNGNNNGIWSAYYISTDQLILGIWSGTFNIPTGQTGTIEILNSTKKSDYRNKLWGNYQLQCNSAVIQVATNDTLSKTSQSIVGKVDSVLNILRLHVTATGFIDTLVQYNSNGLLFDAPGGTVQFSTQDSTMQIHTIQTTAPGVEKRCQCSGRHKY
jgi:hypothetical protein